MPSRRSCAVAMRKPYSRLGLGEKIVESVTDLLDVHSRFIVHIYISRLKGEDFSGVIHASFQLKGDHYHIRVSSSPHEEVGITPVSSANISPDVIMVSM